MKPTPEQRRRQADARLAAAENEIYPVIKRSIGRVVQQIVKDNDLPSEYEADRALTAAISHVRLMAIRDLWEKEVLDHVLPRLLRLFLVTAKRTLDDFRPNGDPAIARNIRDVRATTWLETLKNRLVGIGETMEAEASAALQKSMDLGENPQKRAARVRKALAISEERSRVIARTESAQALNAADYSVSQELGDAGVVHRREWLATMVGPSARRTRMTHREADGQVVGMAEPFLVGGAPLLFPGDPSGPPEETIQCRCTLLLLEPEENTGLVASFTEELHPRDLHGKFIDVSLKRGDHWTQITDQKTDETTWIPRGSESVVQDFLHGRLPTERVRTGDAGVQIFDESGGTQVWIPNSQIDVLKALDRDGHLDAQDAPEAKAGPGAASVGLIPVTPELRTAFKEKFGKSIPPAWTDVNVDMNDGAELIAIGRDAAGRSKYIYTDSFNERKASEKYARLNQVHDKAPQIESGLATIDGDPTKAVARLMLLEGIRVGSSDEQKGKVMAYGASTLLASHASLNPDGSVHLAFTAKEGIPAEYDVSDPELVKFISNRLAQKPSADEPLFATDSNKTIALLREISGLPGMKNHDLRTLLANRIAMAELMKVVPPPPANDREAAKIRKAAAEIVSQQLRNKAAQALTSYINPAVFSRLADRSGA